MLPRERLDRSQIAFDDHLPGGQCRADPAGHPGLLWEMYRVGAMGGEKLLTLVASALAGGPPVAGIDHADAPRTGGTEQVLGCTVRAPSTLGTFLRGFQ